IQASCSAGNMPKGTLLNNSAAGNTPRQYVGELCPICIDPLETESNTSKAGISSPAAKTSISSRPPDSFAMRSASRLADVPKPGKLGGHDVTMRQRWRSSLEVPGSVVGEPQAVRVPSPPYRKERRCMVMFLLFARHSARK